MWRATLAIGVGIIAAVTVTARSAPVPDPVAGKKYAQIECAGCHVITEKRGKRPPQREQGAAPHFATIAHDPAMTPEKIRETLKLPHGSMANLVVSEKDTENILSYIGSLRGQ
jgi:mono/diheme cytochrome c family protein